MPLPWAIPAATMTADRFGCCSAMMPTHAKSTSESVHVSLKAAPAALEPMGAA